MFVLIFGSLASDFVTAEDEAGNTLALGLPWSALLQSSGKGQFHPDSECPDWAACGALPADAQAERWVNKQEKSF